MCEFEWKAWNIVCTLYIANTLCHTTYLALVSSSAEECRTILGGGGRALLGLLPGTL